MRVKDHYGGAFSHFSIVFVIVFGLPLKNMEKVVTLQNLETLFLKKNKLPVYLLVKYFINLGTQF